MKELIYYSDILNNLNDVREQVFHAYANTEDDKERNELFKAIQLLFEVHRALDKGFSIRLKK